MAGGPAIPVRYVEPRNPPAGRRHSGLRYVDNRFPPADPLPAGSAVVRPYRRENVPMLSRFGAVLVGESSRSGRLTTSVAPPPSVLSTRTEPPCEPTMAATIARPRPLPPVSRVREVSAR